MKEAEIKEKFFKASSEIINEINRAKKLPHNNGKTIIDFDDDYNIKKELSANRRLKILITLKNIAIRINKPFNSITKKDIDKLFIDLLKNGYTTKRKINGKETTTKKKYSPYTIKDFKVVLKIFLRWLNEEKFKEILEDKFLKANIRREQQKVILPSDLLTNEEATALLGVAESKGTSTVAWVSCLLESGMRVHELATALVRQIEFIKNENNEIIKCNFTGTGKTGAFSYRLVTSTPYLYRLITKDHPLKNSPDFQNQPLFTMKTGNQIKPISYDSLRISLKRMGLKAGIQGKKLTPHFIGRHRRGSFILSKFPTPVAYKIMNWSMGSKVGITTYFHFTKEDAFQAVDELNGLAEHKNNKKDLELKICPVCSTKSSPTALVCSNPKCKTPLNYLKLIQEHENNKEEKTKQQLKIKELEEKMKLFEDFINSTKTKT